MQKLVEIEKQIERTVDSVSALHQKEDSLANLASKKIEKERRRLSMQPVAYHNNPSAKTTPKTTGEYRNLINDLLDITEKGASSDCNAEKIQRLLSRAVQNNQSIEHVGRHKLKSSKKHDRDEDHGITSTEESDSSPEKKKKGKLCSGRVARIESLDIKRQVLYPHAKLNGEFTSVHSYNELSLNLFMAGELETIIRMVDTAEQEARLQILLMCMYHSQFLDIEDIKDQYDVTMKMIERKELNWGDSLGQRVDRALDRRLRLKDRTGKVGEKGVKVTSKGSQSKGKEEFIYCNAFNKGVCQETNSHKGKFGMRDGVLLNHACKRCLKEKGVRVGHAEVDTRCLYNPMPTGSAM